VRILHLASWRSQGIIRPLLARPEVQVPISRNVRVCRRVRNMENSGAACHWRDATGSIRRINFILLALPSNIWSAALCRNS
jgi:hypothetical protein